MFIPEYWLTSPFYIEQNVAYYLDSHAKIRPIATYSQYLEVVDTGHVVKLERVEHMNPTFYKLANDVKHHFNHVGPVTIHAFISPAGSSSFDLHTDPDDVLIYVVDGCKTMITYEDGQLIEHRLNEGDSLFIPANRPHRAVNTCKSITLSIGLEKFLEEKLFGCIDNG